MIGDCALKNGKLGEGIGLVEIKFAHSYMSNTQKNSQIRTLIKQLLAKYRIFKKLPQMSHTFLKKILKVLLKLFRPTDSTL